jgi:hypothetical protein
MNRCVAGGIALSSVPSTTTTLAARTACRTPAHADVEQAMDLLAGGPRTGYLLSSVSQASTSSSARSSGLRPASACSIPPWSGTSSHRGRLTRSRS